MSKIDLTNGRAEDLSQPELDAFYQGELIPAEKKPFLTDLKNGVGAYLPTEKGRYILDGSSQIATLGLGFNPSVFFGVTHFGEAWLNAKSTPDFERLRSGYESFFGRKLGWSVAHAFFSNAGAEANEIALGAAFARRRSPRQSRVLAFEGSFHGRMLISLGATSNAAKRVPYEWPSFQARFAAWPEMKSDHSGQPPIPDGWRSAWENGSHAAAPRAVSAFAGHDELLDLEIGALLDVRAQLAAGDVYAIILEPRQCEGGDRYASARFHNGLVNLARSFGVPVIYDEVQCGFGLSGEFFWHRLFDLRDGAGHPIGPDYVTCAKKAQLGVTLSRERIDLPEQFAAHSLLRGYAQALAMDQGRARVRAIEAYVRPRLEAWVATNAADLECPRVQGLSFSVDFKDSALLNKFIAKRFEKGLMYYPAGSNTARFRLSLAFRDSDIDLLLHESHDVLEIARGNRPAAGAPSGVEVSPPSDLWDFHLRQAERLRRELNGENVKVSRDDALAHLRDSKRVRDLGLSAHWIDRENFEEFRGAILALEEECYEPIRRTPVEEFLSAVDSKLGFGLAIRRDAELVGICFLGDLREFGLERGTRNDPHFEDPRALYAIDLTVAKTHQGKGLGQLLKQAAYLGALSQGANRICGRNRDGLAAAMWAINLSLGGYELQHLANDYPDDGPNRDCLYYTNRLSQADGPPLRLDGAFDAPWGEDDLTEDFMERAFGGMVNKVCLSNWVSREFLADLKTFTDQLPPSLRHCYTASGQSECVDKAIKSIWSHRKHERVLAFEGGYFGAGSFMARSLSGVGERVFPVVQLPEPNELNWRDVLARVRTELESAPTHSVWIEPVGQRTLRRAPIDFLRALVELGRKHGVPTVFNDTASLLGRLDGESFCASALVEPDLGIAFVGGQMGVVYARKEFYVAKPLEIISTWDGDEYSLAAFAQATRRWAGAKRERAKLMSEFDAALRAFLEPYGARELELTHGLGSFQGALPPRHRAMFGKAKGETGGESYRIAANHASMRRFVSGWKKL